MKRPFFACGVLMFFMGGALMAIGAGNQRPPRVSADDAGPADMAFCAAPWPADWDCSEASNYDGFATCPAGSGDWMYEGPALCYRNCCGYDRGTGEHYAAANDSPLNCMATMDERTGYDAAHDMAVYGDSRYAATAPRRGFAALVCVLPDRVEDAGIAGPWQPRSDFAESAAILRSLLPWLDVDVEGSSVQIPLAVEIRRSSSRMPSFYDADEASAYAAAQSRIASEERSRFSFHQLTIRDARPSWQPSKEQGDGQWLRVSDRISAACDWVRSVGQFPLRHNVRITRLWLERRAAERLAEWRLDDDWRQAALYAGTWRKSVSHMDLEWPEYQQLIERAIEACPDPSKTPAAPRLRPLPSRQQMMRIAAQTLESLSDALAWTAERLDGWATEDIATRPSSRSAR